MTTSIMTQLQADNLLSGTSVLDQVESLKVALRYQSDDQVVSFDDHFTFLQKGIDSIQTIKLLDRVPQGVGPKYENSLLSALEYIQDEIERWKVKAIRFQGDVMQAKSEVDELRSAFESWYYLAAIEVLAEADLKFPATNIKSLASSEFTRLMNRSNISLDTLIEVLKIEVKRLDTKQKMARTKFDMGRQQVTTALYNTLPETLGISPSAPLNVLAESTYDDDPDLVPSFVSRTGNIMGVIEVPPAPELSEIPEPKDVPDDGPAAKTETGFFKTGTPMPVTVIHDPETIPLEPRHVELDPEVPLDDDFEDDESEDEEAMIEASEEREEERKREEAEEEAMIEASEEEAMIEASIEREEERRREEAEEEAMIEASEEREEERKREEAEEEAMIEASIEREQETRADEASKTLPATPISTVEVEDDLGEKISIMAPRTSSAQITDLSDFDLDDFAAPVHEEPAPAPAPKPAPAPVVEPPAPAPSVVEKPAPVSTRKPMNFDFDDDDL